MTCDHKFIDSVSCLKCGWTPPAKQVRAKPVADPHPLEAHLLKVAEQPGHSEEARETLRFASTIVSNWFSAPPPPTSELEGRLRALAKQLFASTRLENPESALLLEAADAYQAALGIISDLRANLRARISDLESELAEARQHVLNEAGACIKAEDELQRSKSQGWHDMRKRAEAAEGEVGRLREEAASWRRVAEAAESRVTWLEQRIATKDSLIESLKAEQLAKVEELEAAEAQVEALRDVCTNPRNLHVCGGAWIRRDPLTQALATPAQAEETAPCGCCPADSAPPCMGIAGVVPARSHMQRVTDVVFGAALATPAQPSEEAE